MLPNMHCSDDNQPTDECAGCAVHTARRDFLRSLAATAAGALLSLGASAKAARALTPTFTTGSRHRDGEISFPLPTADGVSIDKENEVILTRYKNAVYAFALSCPHQSNALKWLSREGRFQCSKHKSQYQPNGEFIEGRATRGMDRYAIRRDGAKVVVNLDKLFEQDKDGAAWSAAQISCP